MTALITNKRNSASISLNSTIKLQATKSGTAIKLITTNFCSLFVVISISFLPEHIYINISRKKLQTNFVVFVRQFTTFYTFISSNFFSLSILANKTSG